MSSNFRLTTEDKEALDVEEDVQIYPTTASHIMQDLLPEWERLFLDKHAGYGGMHNDLGLKAQYVDIHRKTGKLRLALWEGKKIGPETAREVLMDLIGHCFLTIDLIDQDAEVRM